MSISNKFFENLKARANPDEVYYYAQRCLFNAGRSDFPSEWSKEQIRDERENCLDQAHRLYDLFHEIKRKSRAHKSPARVIDPSQTEKI